MSFLCSLMLFIWDAVTITCGEMVHSVLLSGGGMYTRSPRWQHVVVMMFYSIIQSKKHFEVNGLCYAHFSRLVTFPWQSVAPHMIASVFIQCV